MLVLTSVAEGAVALRASAGGVASGRPMVFPDGACGARRCGKGWPEAWGSGMLWQAQWEVPGEPPPVEENLSVGTLRLLRSLRRGLRRLGKTVGAAANRWADWALRGLAFVALILVAPLADLALLRTWYRNGFQAARHAALLGIAVNVRLLIDRRVPALARLPLVFAVIYGVAVLDLMPDGRAAWGRIDDIVVTLLAARLFTALCPESRIAAHARRVSRQMNALRPRRTQRTPADGGLA